MEGDKAGLRSVEILFVEMAVHWLVAMSRFLAQLIADDIHVAGGFNSDAYGVRSDAHNRHRDLVADQNFLTRLTRKYQHAIPLSWSDKASLCFRRPAVRCRRPIR